MKLIEERIPSDQYAMLDYDGELLGENPPHLLATTLDKVVADFRKPAHDTTKELQTKKNKPEASKPWKKPAALRKSLLDLMGSMEQLLVAGDMLLEDADDNDSNMPLSEIQCCLRCMKDAAVNTGGMAAAGKIVRIGSSGGPLCRPREVTLDIIAKPIQDRKSVV